MKIRRLNLSALSIFVILAASGCGKGSPEPGSVKDEALTVGRTAESLPAADEDYFKDMDGAVELTANEVRGRNNWIVWTGGNDRFWDDLSYKYSFGTIDLLKTISSHSSSKHGRHDRWMSLGVVNEPSGRPTCALSYLLASGIDASSGSASGSSNGSQA